MRRGGVLARLLRLPALHFVLIGGVLFAVTTRVPPQHAQAAPRRAPIVIPATTIVELRAEHRAATGAAPTAAELRALIAGEVDQEVLYREGLLLGLDRVDSAVEQRVVEKMRFLYGADAGSDAEAYRRGLELGLQRDDAVVRRTLITRMQLLAKRASLALEPEGAALEAVLEAHLAAHADAYRQPAALDLHHVFFSADRRGAAAAADAAAFRRRLDATSPGVAAARGGDVFPLGHAFRDQSPRALAKIFGTDFAATVTALAPGAWSDPVWSSYGAHLVWVTARRPAHVPRLADVRPRVLRAYRAARHDAYLDELLAALRGMYEVRVEAGGAAEARDDG